MFSYNHRQHRGCGTSPNCSRFVDSPTLNCLLRNPCNLEQLWEIYRYCTKADDYQKQISKIYIAQKQRSSVSKKCLYLKFSVLQRRSSAWISFKNVRMCSWETFAVVPRSPLPSHVIIKTQIIWASQIAVFTFIYFVHNYDSLMRIRVLMATKYAEYEAGQHWGKKRLWLIQIMKMKTKERWRGRLHWESWWMDKIMKLDGNDRVEDHAHHDRTIDMLRNKMTGMMRGGKIMLNSVNKQHA